MNRLRPLRIGAMISGCIVLVLIGFLMTPTGCYLGRAGWEEAKILAGRRPIEALVADPTLDDATRAKLRIVLAARAFAADSLSLAAGRSFTMFTKLERDTLLLLLSAARRDALEARTWWFPIVGRVPYKGFFHFDQAHREARRLESDGYDTFLRPASAFSTLGWFNDPLLSTTLRLDSLELTNTVIHELVHNTFYPPGQAVFNESFANFVGARGAAWFFRSRGDTIAAELVELRWEDDKRLARFWTSLWTSLDSAFRAHPEDIESRLAAREDIYARARGTLRTEIAPSLRTFPPSFAERVRLDNAALLARRVYMTDLDVYDAVLEREDGDVRRAIDRIIALARAADHDPFVALREWLDAPGVFPE
ncbi:MAG TPA: aminopeptidase [Gemmatimonadaceae bacterium]|nr:aminopeptidase [Gemmatimonadaceae bacterium]